VTSAVAVSVEDVAKRFRRYHVRNQSVKSALFRGGRGRYEEFWVLDGVSFDVPAGETFGIIGSNGSGKSTLLKCMARILQPDRGQIRSQGKMSALLELGAGFHPELSGRDNVYLNGAILGLRRREIDARFDEIVAFAGRQIVDAIDQPIKTYSSGMYVRLGFSIAVNVEPDILLVDEVLAVGDEEFQRRCKERFDQLANDGRTVVIVSHALATMAAMCDHVAWLEAGKLAQLGRPQGVIDAYLGGVDFGHSAENDRTGRHEVHINDVAVVGDERRDDVVTVRSGGGTTFEILYDTEGPVATPTFAFTVHSLDGTLVANPSTYGLGGPEKVDGPGRVGLDVSSLMLVPGSYLLGAALLDPAGEHAFDKRLRHVRFDVVGDSPGESRGLVRLGGRWSGLDRLV
jgi:ABC-2 type transport system ATP-binding protein